MATYGLTEVMTSGQGVFILKFQDMDGVSRAVEEGQLTIGGQPFLVRKCTTNLPMLINDVKKVAIWVRMYDIPLEFWTPKGLSYIASAIGTSFYADSITEGGTRLDFARICIKIKVDAECPDSISLTLSNGESMVINVEYGWKPLKCNGCQCFGHSTANCAFASKLEDSSTSRKVLKDRAGMVVSKKQYGKDNMMQVAKGYDKKAKGKSVEIQNPGCDGTSTSGVDDTENEDSATIVPFGGKLKVDEMDLRKKDVDMKSMNLGKKLAKLKKANPSPPLSK
ncbi:uncharacterized protein LOC123205587 [Mangifera indica]|uniref:uncharacterized protein LOC123205587 n=1 Tax=Mangifera indica TaxID=29780 RepID=UPI001CFB4C3C|nr:uncharacterized protein LOC123205587 [Mangifera indica]